jgi:hypothetical protein
LNKKKKKPVFKRTTSLVAVLKSTELILESEKLILESEKFVLPILEVSFVSNETPVVLINELEVESRVLIIELRVVSKKVVLRSLATAVSMLGT